MNLYRAMTKRLSGTHHTYFVAKDYAEVVRMWNKENKIEPHEIVYVACDVNVEETK